MKTIKAYWSWRLGYNNTYLTGRYWRWYINFMIKLIKANEKHTT